LYTYSGVAFINAIRVRQAFPEKFQQREKIPEEGTEVHILFPRERKWIEKFEYRTENDQLVCVMGKKSIGKFYQENLEKLKQLRNRYLFSLYFVNFNLKR